MQLAATDDERRDIGGSLADALAYFDDTAPFVKLLNFIGPWSGVIDGLSRAVYDRILYVAEHRVPPPGIRRPPPPPPPAYNGRAATMEDDIVAPDPGFVT